MSERWRETSLREFLLNANDVIPLCDHACPRPTALLPLKQIERRRSLNAGTIPLEACVLAG
jgi:hypothetical protein